MLLAASDDQALQALIEAYALDHRAIEALKDHSARSYFDRPAEALRVAEVAFRLGLLLPDPTPALGRWTLANALMFADRYREATELFDLARTHYIALGHPLDAARMGVGHVWALAYTGQFERALALAAEIEPVLRAAAVTDQADRRRLGGLFNNLGILYEVMGQYEESLAAYDRKLEIAQALGNELDAARTQHNRARALTFLNAFDEALAAFEQGRSGFQAARATADLARLAFNEGTLYTRWGRYTEAETAFAESERQLATLEQVEQFRAVLALYRNLARLASSAAPDEKVLEELSAARTALATHGPPFEEGLAWLGLGRCHLISGHLDAAQVAFDQALKLAEEGAGRPLAYMALYGLGNLAEARGDQAAAVDIYEQAVSRIEAMRRDIQIETFRASFLTDKLVIFQDLALLYARLGRIEDAFATVERAKSRLLAERLAGRISDEAAALVLSDDPRTRDRARQLQDVLAQLERVYNATNLDQHVGRGETWLPVSNAEALAEIERLEEEALSLMRQIERDQPQFASMTTGYTATLQDAQVRLQDAVLLQYHIARGRVWAFVVDRTGIQMHRDLASLAEVVAPQRRFMAAVERALGLSSRYGAEILNRYLPSLLADAQAQLATLYDLLLRPLATDLPRGVTLVISPDGPLHYVPFHALFDGKAYLIEQYTISYTPSATVLDLCARRIAAGRGILIVGYSDDQLEQVAVEVQALTGLFPTADCWVEAQATTRQFLIDAPHYRIVHLATHAHFRADNVILSSLSLADRRLTLAEVARLKLNTDLITLSGCETGRGLLNGADLISLAGGFLGAGARSLLVSLWRVDDGTTARLMQDFYQALLDGNGRASALRTAQLSLLAQGRESSDDAGHSVYSHPAYWAPFIMIGERGQLISL
jgi:CHAT domain-containing protein